MDRFALFSGIGSNILSFFNEDVLKLNPKIDVYMGDVIVGAANFQSIQNELFDRSGSFARFYSNGVFEIVELAADFFIIDIEFQYAAKNFESVQKSAFNSAIKEIDSLEYSDEVINEILQRIYIYNDRDWKDSFIFSKLYDKRKALLN